MSHSPRFACTVVLSLCLALFFVGCGGATAPSNANGGGAPNPPAGGGGSGGGAPTSPATDAQLITDTVAANLQGPWSLVFAPDGRLFFTESVGRLRVITNGQLQTQPVLDISSQTPGFEGGLTGMDLDRAFSSNGFLYAHYCTRALHCRVVRVSLTGNTGAIDRVLLDYPITNFDHVGGRLKVGPDNLIYLTLGDHQNRASAQDPASWDGKIIRMNLDGTAAGVGLANAYVYSLGHRDPQGIAWDSSNTLYETEHGETGLDEVNIIRAGANYGWPACEGACNSPGFVDPLKVFPKSPSTPPSGMTFYASSVIPGWNGTLLFAVLGLAGNDTAHHVHQLQFNAPGGSTITFEQALFTNEFGRIRDVAVGPDGFLYFSTANRGTSVTASADDDRILRARPK
jgi:glucose/arabinose dehydrogenase